MTAKSDLHTLGTVGLVLVSLLYSGVAEARCKNTGSFKRWLADFKKHAAEQGISQRAISAGLRGVRFDPGVIKRDGRQAVFSQSFLKFAGRMISAPRFSKGRTLLKKHRRTFSRIEREYGVPGPVIVAFWGLETDYGVNMGNGDTLRSLATLAYDCRRPEMFRKELLAALRIIERGDLRPSQMRGPWAGELGQTQFLPSHYLNYAVDFDGDGRRDLLRSVPDAMASTANYIVHLGWKRGQPWLQEVRVPQKMPWEQADVNIRHPRSKWVQWGVRLANGGALPSDPLPAALLLPMGRNGPAFLAYPNFFNIYLEWNHSLTYTTTAGYFATRLAGAPRMRKPRAKIRSLGFSEIKQLQNLLSRRGYDVGRIDGIIGAGTRESVRDVQKKLGLPADSYPTPQLLARLRVGG